jgi:hypothetical protein
VRPGDCLLIENWDRLSRQNIWAAIGLVNDLRQLGIHVGRLDRGKMLRCDSNDPGDFFEAAIELMRGNSESAAKSERNGKAWVRKRAAAREGHKVLSRMLPAWVELVGAEMDGQGRLVGGTLQPIPERAAVVRRIFSLANAGYGYYRIVQRLNKEGIPPFTAAGEHVLGEDGEPVLHNKGRRAGKPRLRAAKGTMFGAGRWTVPYVIRILKDRRVLGELQPRGARGRGRKVEGEPIPGYYPAIVTVEEFNAAQVARGDRDKCDRQGSQLGTRQGKHLNLFAGLLVNALDGDPYIAASKRGRVLVTQKSNEGGGVARSIPLHVFEDALFKCLKEIDPHAILNGDDGPDETLALGGELEQVRAAIAAIEAELDEHGESPTLYRRLRTKEDRERDLVARLAAARERAAHPLSETWGQAQTLMDALARASDPIDARLRLRAALRRMIDRVYLLVVPRGRTRLAAVQVWFAGGKRCRNYLITHRLGRGNKTARTPACWWVRSFADAPVRGSPDLRNLKHALALADVLQRVELEEGTS